MTGLTDEVLELLASHAGQRVDFSAIYILLNTTAGGHYQERFAEPDVHGCLQSLLDRGAIEAWRLESNGTAADSVTYYRLRAA